MLECKLNRSPEEVSTKRSKRASVRKGKAPSTDENLSERAKRSNRRRTTSAVEEADDDKENVKPRVAAGRVQKKLKPVLEPLPLLHQMLEQKLEISDAEKTNIEEKIDHKENPKTPMNKCKSKKQPTIDRKEGSLEVPAEVQSAECTSSPDQKLPITPPNSDKKAQMQIRQTVSQSCSAIGRKRKGLFPGYERFQKVKSAFCPKQQFFDQSDSEDDVFDQKENTTSSKEWSAREIIPGRTDELNRLETLIEELLQNGKSSSLYISGPPGTGKSACVTAVLRQFRHTHGDNYAHVKIVNCVRCRTKQSILETIGCSADGKIVKSFGSKQKTAKKQLPLIVVLDEVDQVEMSHRTFIYEMFEWVSSNREDTPKKETGGIKKGSPILLIAIANALDLTERVLPRLALSSVKPELMHYKPYSASQLVDIIHDRINKVATNDRCVGAGASCVLDRGAIELCARKVASATGDARKALELCRKAIEVVQREAMRQYQALHSFETPPTSPLDKAVPSSDTFSCRVTITVMNRVIAESFSSWASTHSHSLTDDDVTGGAAAASDSCPLHHKIIITALARLTKQCTAAYFSIQQVLSKYNSVCSEKGISSLDQSQMLMVLDLLEARGLIQLTHPTPANRRHNRAADFKALKVYIKGNLFELLSATELDA